MALNNNSVNRGLCCCHIYILASSQSFIFNRRWNRLCRCFFIFSLSTFQRDAVPVDVRRHKAIAVTNLMMVFLLNQNILRRKIAWNNLVVFKCLMKHVIRVIFILFLLLYNYHNIVLIMCIKWRQRERMEVSSGFYQHADSS